MTKLRAFDLCRRDPWAIMPERLEQILDIAGRHASGDKNADLEAVAARIGRPLDNTRTVTVRDGVATIPISGPIFRFASFFTQISGATSVEDAATDFTAALENPDVKAIILDVDSPGGQVAGVMEFAKMIYDARGQKPIVTYSGDLMASAAYWIGSAADEVFTSPSARIGSIGVVAAYTDRKRADKQAGIDEYKFISSKSPKKQPDPSTEDGAKDIQGVVDDLADLFIGSVAQNRGVSVATVENDFGQGAVMIAEKALQAGMIDGISTLEAIQAKLSGMAPTVKTTIRANEKNNPTMKTQEKSNMPEKTETKETPQIIVDRAYLDANHADLVKSIVAEGATAERERIAAIDENTIPGHEDLAEKAKADGSSPEAFVMAQTKAEKGNRQNALSAIGAGAPAPVKVESDAPAPKVEKKAKADDESLTLEERAEAAWEAQDAEYKNVFAGGKKAFITGWMATAKGHVKTR